MTKKRSAKTIYLSRCQRNDYASEGGGYCEACKRWTTDPDVYIRYNPDPNIRCSGCKGELIPCKSLEEAGRIKLVASDDYKLKKVATIEVPRISSYPSRFTLWRGSHGLYLCSEMEGYPQHPDHSFTFRLQGSATIINDYAAELAIVQEMVLGPGESPCEEKSTFEVPLKVVSKIMDHIKLKIFFPNRPLAEIVRKMKGA